MRKSLILSSIYLLLSIIVILINFSIPLFPFADNDITGYLEPALSWHQGGPYTHAGSRSFIYPLFITACLWLGSFQLITYIQTFVYLGALLFAIYSWNGFVLSLNTHFRIMVGDILGIALFIILGFSHFSVYHNHSIRPESLFMSSILILIGMIIQIFKKKALNQKPYSVYSLSFVIYFSLFLYVLYPRWILCSGVVIVFFIIQLYKIKQVKFVTKALAIVSPFILFLFTIWIPEQNLMNKYDPAGHLFLKRQFYYAHYDIAENDLIEQLNLSYQNKVDGDLKNSNDKKFFKILGYNPDVLMFGERNHFIDSSFNYKVHAIDSFYSLKDKEILYKSTYRYTSKFFRQLRAFFDWRTSVNSIPGMYQTNIQQEYASTYFSLSSLVMQYGNNSKLTNYYTFINSYRSYASPTFFAFSYLAMPLQFGLKFFLPLIFIMFLIITIWSISRRGGNMIRQHKWIFQLSCLLVCMMCSMILVPALIHTFDMIRYWICFLPITIFFIASSLLLFISLVKIEVEQKILFWVDNKILNRKVLISFVLFLLCLHGISTLYYARQYHFFDPYIQNPLVRPKTQVKQDNEFRVLMLGGSTTANFHLPEKDRYPFIMEQNLQKAYPDKKIVVINGANDWYSSRHSLINYASYYYEFDPDVVVIMHAINDLYRSFTPPEFSYGEYDSLYTHFYGPSIQGVNPPTFTKYIIQMVSAQNSIGGFVTYKEANYPLDEFKSLLAYKKNMERLVALCTDDGADVFIVSQPNLYSTPMPDSLSRMCWFNKKFCNRRISIWEYEYPSLTSMDLGMNKYNEVAKEIAFSKSVHFINAAQEMPKSTILFTDDVHYTPTGSRWIADMVSDALIKELKMTQ